MAAGLCAAPDQDRGFPADFRLGRYLDESLPGRMSVSRDASGGAQLCDFSGQCLRVGKPAPRTLLQNGSHSGHNQRAARGGQSRVSLYAGPASHLTESNPKIMRLPAAGRVPPGALAAYVPDARRYDELLDDKGLIRPHWQHLIEQLTRDDPRAVARRGLERTRRLIVENGVTYNVYADPQGADRPWALDSVPLLLLAEEWRAIEAGLSQRARLLDALLADLYGPQRLLSEGLVPPELVFGHPNFLWPCQGIQPRGGNWLHVYAADLARAPDGHWWLLADRTQAPSG